MNIFNQDDVATAEKALIAQDPILNQLISKQKLHIPKQESDYFYALCSSIISQQVSLAAAKTIFQRFESLTHVNPKIVNTLSIDELRTCGISRQKAGYILDLAQHFNDNPTQYNHLEALPDDEIVLQLTEIKGVGVWTAQMFLIFTLGRMNVFAPADIGLQNAAAALYGLSKPIQKTNLLDISEQWNPYKTIASLHLWQFLDNKPA